MSDDVLDLGPRLRARRHQDCRHAEVTVDLTIALLTCDACEAELDPWWYLRRMATEDQDIRQETDRVIAQRILEANEKIGRLNEVIKQKNDEVAALYATKNRLQNEMVGDVRVGAAVKRSRKPRVSPARCD